MDREVSEIREDEDEGNQNTIYIQIYLYIQYIFKEQY